MYCSFISVITLSYFISAGRMDFEQGISDIILSAL